MSGDIGIGKLISGDAQRDAIHIAVLPARASERLAPGQHVSVVNGVAAASVGKAIGIVDPFLTAPAFEGDCIWVFLYPGSITSLRHEWTHAAIDGSAATAPAAAVKPTKEQAEAFLRKFASEWNVDFAEMVRGAKCRDGITARDIEIHDWCELPDNGAAFWLNLEAYLGRTFDQEHRRNTYFSCSCG